MTTLAPLFPHPRPSSPLCFLAPSPRFLVFSPPPPHSPVSSLHHSLCSLTPPPHSPVSSFHRSLVPSPPPPHSPVSPLHHSLCSLTPPPHSPVSSLHRPLVLSSSRPLTTLRFGPSPLPSSPPLFPIPLD